MKTKIEMFEDAMRKSGMFDDDQSVMERDPETGGFKDKDTNAMWADFLVALGEVLESPPKKETPSWHELDAYEYGFFEGYNECLRVLDESIPSK